MAKSRAAALDARDYIAAASHTSVFGSRWVNEFRTQFAYRDQVVESLDPLCGGPCAASDQGGPTLEVTGVASVGRQRFTPRVAPIAGAAARHRQLLARCAPVQGRRRLQLHRPHGRPGPAAALRRPLHLPVAAGYPGRAAGARLGHPGRGPGLARRLRAGLRRRHRTRTATRPLAVRPGRLARHVGADAEVRACGTRRSSGPTSPTRPRGTPAPSGSRATSNNLAPRVAASWDPTGRGRTSVHAAYGIFFDNHITGLQGITNLLDGSEHVRTLVRTFPATLPAWNAPDRRLPETAAGTFPSLQFLDRPRPRDALRPPRVRGPRPRLGDSITLSANFVYVRGFKQLGTIDYNPVVPALGPGRRPEDVGGVAGTSASILQYT